MMMTMIMPVKRKEMKRKSAIETGEGANEQIKSIVEEIISSLFGFLIVKEQK